ncbi:MAG: hypothetical protein ACRC6V_06685 [Bacteroidales bacterium]
MKKIILATAIAALMSGCAANTSHLKSNSFSGGQVNQQQEAKTVQIITVMPATINVDNSANKQGAMAFGSIIGAAGGALLGDKHGGKATTVMGGAGGAALGGAAASVVVSDRTEVEGVTLAYQMDGKVFTSAQVGQMCEYQPGIALMIDTGKAKETRIQPNAVCPKK